MIPATRPTAIAGPTGRRMQTRHSGQLGGIAWTSGLGWLPVCNLSSLAREVDGSYREEENQETRQDRQNTCPHSIDLQQIE